MSNKTVSYTKEEISVLQDSFKQSIAEWTQENEDLQIKLEALEDRLSRCEDKEPENSDTVTWEKWDERREKIEDKINEVELDIRINDELIEEYQKYLL